MLDHTSNHRSIPPDRAGNLSLTEPLPQKYCAALGRSHKCLCQGLLWVSNRTASPKQWMHQARPFDWNRDHLRRRRSPLGWRIVDSYLCFASKHEKFILRRNMESFFYKSSPRFCNEPSDCLGWLISVVGRLRHRVKKVHKGVISELRWKESQGGDDYMFSRRSIGIDDTSKRMEAKAMRLDREEALLCAEKCMWKGWREVTPKKKKGGCALQDCVISAPSFYLQNEGMCKRRGLTLALGCIIIVTIDFLHHARATGYIVLATGRSWQTQNSVGFRCATFQLYPSVRYTEPINVYCEAGQVFASFKWFSSPLPSPSRNSDQNVFTSGWI